MRGLLLASAFLVFAAGLPAQQTDPAKLPTRDQHQNFLVAVRVYTSEVSAKKEFHKLDPIKTGLLPVEVFFRNDAKDPVHVDLSTIRMEVRAPNGQRFRLKALSLQQAADAIAHPKGPPDLTARRFPPLNPLPHRDNKVRDAEKKLQPLTFQTDIVPPGGTVHGFLFFDVSHNYSLLPYSSLYVPDVKSVASKQGLIYFEVPLAATNSH